MDDLLQRLRVFPGSPVIDRPRDEKHFQDGSAELQIPPLRFAPVGMTKGTATFPFTVTAAPRLFLSSAQASSFSAETL
jgi:hypothetical protein